MSNVEGQLQSTPSRHRLTVLSQAGSEQNKREEIKEEIALDLGNAVKCKYDGLLKYFLYLVLDEDSEEKKKLDELQVQIEELQSQRYYKKENAGDGGGNDDGLDDTAAGPSSMSGIPEQARQEEADDDFENGTDKEKELVQERDEILEGFLDQTIVEVLPTANDADIKKLLDEFQTKLRSKEIDRYGPYVELCNEALDRLSTVGEQLPLRGPDELDIQFQRNDPSDIVSKYEGANSETKLRPDVGVASRAALSRIHKCQKEDFKQRPPSHCPLRWKIMLSSNEFKVFDKNHPHGIIYNLKRHIYEKDDEINETEHNQLAVLDVPTEEEEEMGVDGQTAGSSKRSREAASLGGGEEQPPKRARTPRTTPAATPSGSKTNSKANSKTSASTKPVPVEKKTKKAIEGRVQCASYALEMLSYSAGVHHAINLLFTDGILWVWYYDRQGIVQSSGISIFHDFPRFLVLLLAFQRFSIRDWGIVPALNPDAVHEHARHPSEDEDQRQQQPKKKGKKKAAPKRREEDPAPPVVLDLREDLMDFKDFSQFWQKRGDNRMVKLTSVELNMKEHLSNQPHCLAGRATAVVPAIGRGGMDDLPMVCKVYHPEVQRRHEGLTMEVIYEIARDDERNAQQDEERAKLGKLSMFNHLPTFYFHGDMKETTTQRVRSMVRRRWKGHRTTRIIGMKQLRKITTISGWEFVKAWLEGVICHAFLWKNFVEHGDPSVSNLMYDPETKCGVLTDFDLSLLQWEPRVFGTDRTGTVPFMALDLLTEEYWSGKIKRYYHHELESFIWILPYVFLLYQDGVRQRSPLVDPWRTSSYDTCREKKADFSTHLRGAESAAQSDFKPCWWLAYDLCRALRDHRYDVLKRVDAAYRGEVDHVDSKPDDYVRDSDDLWDSFYGQLKANLAKLNHPDFSTLLDGLKYYKPGFVLSDKEAQYLHNKYSPILRPAYPM